MPTVEDLGIALKKKYPGAYDDIDNASLGLKLQAKHPGAYDDYAPAIAKAPIPSGLQGQPDDFTKNDAISQKSGFGPDYDPSQTPRQGLAKGVDIVRPMVDAAATGMGITGGAIGGPAGSAIAGAGMGYASDTALQRVRNYLQGNNEDASGLETAATLAGNEVGGRLIGTGLKAAKGLAGKGLTAAQSSLSELSPTFSQYFGKEGSVPKALEDLFAPKTKAAAIENSGTIGVKKIGDIAKKLVGTTDPNEASDAIQSISKRQLRGTYNEADLQATNAKLIAASNPQTTQVGQVPSAILDPNTGQPVMTPVMKTVNGPTYLNSTLEKANDFIQQVTNGNLPPTNDEIPLLRKAQELVDGTQAEFDPQSGKLVKSNPIDFTEAWRHKQDIGSDLSGYNAMTGASPTQKLARTFGHSMNEDIENSIAGWQNGSQQAQQAFQNAKATVEQRNLLFNPEGSGNTNLTHIVEAANSTLPALDATILDPKQLQRVLNAGEQPFPSGNLPAPNGRQAFQGYNTIRIRDASKVRDPISGQFTVNAQKMSDLWNDPSFAKSRDMLYSSQQDSDMTQLYKNLAQTQRKQIGFAPASKIYMGVRGMMLAAPLFTGVLTGRAIEGGAIAGMELGAMGLAKMMSTPKIARAMVAAAAGEPLSMSEQTFARMMAGAIQGTSVAIVNSDGSRTKGTVNKDGAFTSDDSPQ